LFNGDPKLRIREEKRLAILAAERKLGSYRANQAARSLAKGLAYNLVMPILRGYSMQWLHANAGRDQQSLEAVLNEAGFRLSMTFFDEPSKKHLIEELIHARGYCDGLVLLTGVADDDVAKCIKQAGFVHVSNDIRDQARGLNVVCDHSQLGIRQAVTHLRELGHERIGYLGQEMLSEKILSVREAVLQQVMMEVGCDRVAQLDCRLPRPDNAWIDPQWRRLVRKAMNAFLDRPASERATALIASDDRAALEMIDVMDRRGLEPGRDLSIIGYGDLEQTLDCDDPILTTISNPQEMIGRRSAQLLLDQLLRDQKQIIQENILVELIVRSSTGPCLA
jgi:DNA-binding LacI/PurR family transcriptional regulator